ncbi:hypothetical protein D6829_01175 [Candidatus Pacearchaeota archaeon]|nr:MAG: hypothetical protein D6829_01175 [Candidatus Pacearchaeota archaeon]
MRWVSLFIVLSMLPLVIGGKAISGFYVEGCKIGAESLNLGTCSADGRYFCDMNGELKDTISDKFACSFGKSFVPSTVCCPAGYVCDSKSFFCKKRVNSCSSFKDYSSCKSNNCYWVSSKNKCVSAQRDFSCSFYTTKKSCEADLWNLGTAGIGSEVCGTVFDAAYSNKKIGFFSPRRKCECKWTGNRCVLSYNVSEEIYKKGENPKSFECQKVINAEGCVSGKQKISWQAKVSATAGGFDNKDGQDVIKASGCVSSSTVRNCGEPLIKLPFFGATNFFVSIFLILAFHLRFLREEFR